MITFLAGQYGRGPGIKYNSRGYWSHIFDDWTINDAVPDLRLDLEPIKRQILDIYFHNYDPAPGDICVDVGAGIGVESIYLSKMIGESGRIYAIEASPFTYELLRANVRDNHLDNVLCFNLAVADVPGKVKIGGKQGYSHEKKSIFQEQGDNVDAVTMDEFITRHDIERIDFLKVNIEGAEKLLIRQFEHITRVRRVAISCHDFLVRRKRSADDFFVTRKDIEAFLTASNFTVFHRETGVDFKDDWVYGINKDL